MGKSTKGWSVGRLRQFIGDMIRWAPLPLHKNPYSGLVQQTPIVEVRVAAETTYVLVDNSEVSGVLQIEDSGIAVVSDIAEVAAVAAGADLKNHIFALYAWVAAAPDAGYFIPWVYYNEKQTLAAGSIGTATCSMIAPYDGKFISVSVLSNGSVPVPGSTVIGVHKNNDETAMETQTVNMAAFNVTYTGTFSANTFSKGDVLHLNLDATDSLDYVTATVVIEFDEST